MLTKYLAAGLLGSALLIAPVLAEDPAATNAAKEKIGASTTADAYHGDWRASKVVGLNVYNNNNDNIGSINDLLMDKNGAIKAAVVGVGGFLGMGEHLVAIPFDKIKFVNEPVASGSASNAPAPNRPASTTTTGSATTSSTNKNEWYPDHAVFNANKDELKALPEFKYSS